MLTFGLIYLGFAIGMLTGGVLSNTAGPAKQGDMAMMLFAVVVAVFVVVTFSSR